MHNLELAHKLKDLLEHRYFIHTEYNADICAQEMVNGVYYIESRKIILWNPIDLEGPGVFFHEATHALQHVLSYLKPLGFPSTRKGHVAFLEKSHMYEQSVHAIEHEAFCVQTSRTYQKLLFDLAAGELLLRDLESKCRELLGGR